MHTLMLKTKGGQEAMQATAHALRPARIVRGELRHFTGTTFPDGPFNGCSLHLRRLEAFGMIADGDANQWVDVLDEIGDIIHEVPVTPKGFNYLRRKLGFQLEVN